MAFGGMIQCSKEDKERLLLEGKNLSTKQHSVASNVEIDGDDDKN
jgi:hypothetical protein